MIVRDVSIPCFLLQLTPWKPQVSRYERLSIARQHRTDYRGVLLHRGSGAGVGRCAASMEDVEMRAEQLIRQYHAKTITAREFVEGVWEDAKVVWRQSICRGPVWAWTYSGWEAVIGDWESKRFAPENKDGAWAVAADFTISRIEEIRQRQNQYVQLGDDNIRDWGSMESFVICEWLETAAFWATAWV